ncbi:MAG: hypothetical protein O3B73_15925 [bacterium]|nr:hypothetical protein [bacterium]
MNLCATGRKRQRPTDRQAFGTWRFHHTRIVQNRVSVETPPDTLMEQTLKKNRTMGM